MPTKSVLVIGGGAAGSQIAYQLRDLANVTLLDPKTYWEVPMAAPRLLVDPEGLAARTRFDSFLGAARHVRGTATAISDRSVQATLADTSESIAIAFDYAVIATGSTYVDRLMKAQASTEAERALEISTTHERLRRAKSVVVVGGGPVGVETSAELTEAFPHLKVTLVHGGAKLLDTAPSKFPLWAERALRDRNVKVVLNDLVAYPAPGEQPHAGEARTASGLTLAADVVIWAGGVKLNSEWIRASWPDAVQASGRLKVDSFLRPLGHPNVFVAGDLADLPEGRLAFVAGLHAKSVVANLKALLSAPAPDAVKLKPYKPAVLGQGMGKMMVVTLGRSDGLTSLPFGQFRASFMARNIKSKDMLVGMSMKALGRAKPGAGKSSASSAISGAPQPERAS